MPARKPVDSVTGPDAIAALEQKRREVEKSRKAAERKGAHTAVSTMHRLEVDILRHVAELSLAMARPVEDPSAKLTDEQLLDGIIQAVGAMPDSALDRLEDAIARRRTGRPVLKVVEGGEA